MTMSDRCSELGSCGQCRFFVDDPHRLERIFPGILVLSSMYGSSRGDSGICTVRETFQAPESGCEQFEVRDGRFDDGSGRVT